MGTIKDTAKKLVSCPIGAIGGGIGTYFLAKKYGKVENKWALIGLSVVGAVIGAAAEYKIKAHFTKPALAAAKK